MSARLSSRLRLGPSHYMSFFQRIPNSILVSLVQERLNEDDCLKRVRLPGPAWHNAAQLGLATRIRGRDVSNFRCGSQRLWRR